ncbi:MAG: exo-alpha-sialidase [Planctomycetota bacterium]|nr:MAG: exo-alpha-sialidase [Planctomycetota bacterium]
MHAILSILLLSAPAPAQFYPDARVDLGDAPGASASGPPAVHVAGDLVRVAWADYREAASSRMFLNASQDGGRTWLADPIRVNPPGSPGVIGSALAVSGNSVHVFYFDRRKGRPTGAGGYYYDIAVASSQDGGQTWAPEQRLNHDEVGRRFLTFPSVAASGDDVYAVWSQASGVPRKVVFQVSRDRGATWLPFDLDISGGAVSPQQARVATEGDDVYVTWADWRNGPPDVFINVSHDRGVTWKPSPIRLDTGTAPGAVASYCPEIAVDGPYVYVAWYERRSGNNDVFFNRSFGRGEQWDGSDRRLDTGTGPGVSESILPVIAAGNGNVIVGWQQGLGSTVNVSNDFGVTWLPAEIGLNPGPDADRGLNLLVRGDDVYVTYDTLYDGEPWLVHSFDGGRSFQPRLLLSADAATDGFDYVSPALAADSEGNVAVAWADLREFYASGGEEDIYAAAGRYPWLALEGDLTAGGIANFRLSGAGESGARGHVLLSGTGENGQVFLPDASGRYLSLVFDDFTAWAVANLTPLTTAPIANGSAATPNVTVPGLPPGTPIWAAAVTRDPVTGEFLSVTRTLALVVQ